METSNPPYKRTHTLVHSVSSFLFFINIIKKIILQHNESMLKII